MWNMMNFGYGGFGFMMIWPIVFITLIIVLVVKTINSGSKPLEKDNSIIILRERFAKGEIDEEEFNKKMEILKK